MNNIDLNTNELLVDNTKKKEEATKKSMRQLIKEIRGLCVIQ